MGFFNKKENKEQDNRPSTVPEEARWNADENEWEVGEYDTDGDEVGEWKWWLAPNGHLVCHTFYKEDGVMEFTRFHQDGTFSQKGTYVDGLQHGEFISQQSQNPTAENYNARDGYKAVTTFDSGYVVEEHYFDKEGNSMGEPFIS